MSRPDRKSMLIIGASCRAAAWSANNAGYDAWAYDLFSDRDLELVSRTVQLLPTLSDIDFRRFTSDSSLVLLAGGMENQLETVLQLAHKFQVLGPTAAQIQALRSLENWRRWCGEGIDGDSKTQIRLPKTITDLATWQTHSAQGSTRWLRKSYYGAGGLKVCRIHSSHELDFAYEYAMELIDGYSVGVYFLCRDGKANFLGATRNLVFHEVTSLVKLLSPNRIDRTASKIWLASDTPQPFLYSGSFGPYALPLGVCSSLIGWMTPIAEELRLSGVIQADLIVGRNNQAYLLEFNPRWTAGIEVLEIAAGRSLMPEHVACFVSNTSQNDSRPTWPIASHTQVLKLILYAGQRVRVTADVSDHLLKHAFHRYPDRFVGKTRWGWADIPHADSMIESGMPIATILVQRTPCVTATHDDEELLRQLGEAIRQATYLERSLLPTAP